MSETPFEAQRRKLRELKAKQDAGEASVPDQHISPKAQARRDAESEARTHHPAFASKSEEKRVTSQKKAKKKVSG